MLGAAHDSHCNNLSFGYGVYRPPKSTKRLLANCKDVPRNSIETIGNVNRIRKDRVAGEAFDRIAEGTPVPVAAMCRLTMKSNPTVSAPVPFEA